jgi:DNA (cytosine-5)-methyltransferase 1
MAPRIPGFCDVSSDGLDILAHWPLGFLMNCAPMASLNFVSLFAGAGGLDVGFEAAGWRCLYASDHDPKAIGTLRLNQGHRLPSGPAFAETQIRCEEVTSLRARELLARVGQRKGDVAALVGGPPCQSWSSAGHQRGFLDPRGTLFAEFIRLASELDVRWLAFENVRGLLTARGHDGEPGSALRYIRESLLDAGFQTEVNLLNAADYGVPQRRVRLFVIGFRRGDRPPFPTPSHARDVDLFSGELMPWMTLGDCLNKVGGLSEDEIIRPGGALASQLARVADGSGLKSPGKKETTRPGGHWGYKQGAFIADRGLPARTITASSQQDWIRDAAHGLRRLCPRECAAVQTFPDGWRFAGNRAAQYRQIGNAVPPVLAAAIARTLGTHVSQSFANRSRPVKRGYLLPLQPHLESAIEYTRKDSLRNGASRAAVRNRRGRR